MNDPSQQKLVLEIAALPGGHDRRFVVAREFPFFIGRGYDCDLILDDPHIAASQLRIDAVAGSTDTWTVHDMAGGAWINGQSLGGPCVTARSGDSVMTGRTRLRLLSPAHPVPLPVALPQQNQTMATFAKPGNALIYFFITITAIAGWVWLEIWSEDPGLTVTIAVISVTLTIIVWSTLWALAGRVLRHHAQLSGHIVLASTYVLASAAGYYLQSYVDFLANGGFWSTLSGYAINFTLIGTLIYGALGLASELTRKRRSLMAVLFAGGLVLGSYAVTAIESRSFRLEPDYPWTLEPYLSSVAPALDEEAFLKAGDALFDRKSLKIKDKKI